MSGKAGIFVRDAMILVLFGKKALLNWCLNKHPISPSGWRSRCPRQAGVHGGHWRVSGKAGIFNGDVMSLVLLNRNGLLNLCLKNVVFFIRVKKFSGRGKLMSTEDTGE